MATIHIRSMEEVIDRLGEARDRKAAAIEAELTTGDPDAPITTRQAAVLASQTSTFTHELEQAIVAVAFAVGELAKVVGLPALSDGPGVDVEVDDD